ncbi:MAG: glycogen synthase [Frankiaceae bacterium]|jgi:glycogen(starch) synthase|nr:glycogen synthase [Frankiaceae bacterium]
MRMRVLMLSWEYPPLVHGGLGRHVEALAGAVAGLGHEVTVVAPGSAEQPRPKPPGSARHVCGVRVLHPHPSDPVVALSVGDLHGHVATLGAALARVAVAAGRDATGDGDGFDLVCAHDWVVGQAAVSVASALDIPLVVTIHATEAGRHQGWLPGELSRSIHATEHWLTSLAARTVVCSESMRSDVQQLFGLPDARVAVVGNGVDLQRWPHGRPVQEREPLVVFAGRLEYEKGVQVLLRTVARLRRRVPGVRVVVAGTGTYLAELRTLATKLRLGRAVTFTGRLDDDALIALYQQAAVVAVPSIYEPFGLVALEAAACGAPLVVSDVGGLAEFADGGRVALTVAPDDAAALADGLTTVLTDRDLAEKLATRASESADVHGWDAVAERTCSVYRDVLAGGPVDRLPVVEPPADTNLLRPGR